MRIGVYASTVPKGTYVYTMVVQPWIGGELPEGLMLNQIDINGIENAANEVSVHYDPIGDLD